MIVSALIRTFRTSFISDPCNMAQYSGNPCHIRKSRNELQRADLSNLDAPSLKCALDADHLDRYVSLMRKEAKKREISPGVEPIDDFLSRQADMRTLRFRASWSAALAAIQDQTGAMVITYVDPAIPLKLGDFVEVHGTVTMTISAARWKTRASGYFGLIRQSRLYL